MSDLTIDVSQLKTLARDLRRAEPQLARDFLGALGKAGDVVAQRAKLYAAFSDKIPKTIRVRRRRVSVSIQAGGDQAPAAAAFEHEGKLGVFRHPVFRNYDNWVNQQAHPFLRPALEDELPQVEQLVLRAVDEAFVSAGWNG